MNVLGKFRESRDCIDQILAKTDRMRRSEPKSLKAFNFVNGFEQLHERGFVVDLRKFMATIKIYNLPQQGDFFHSARNEMAHFAGDFIDGTAAFRSTRLRHNAECAVHVASLHDRDK